MTIQLKNRLKSLGWRVGMMTLAFAVDAVIANLGILEIPKEFTVLIGLVLGEISKSINVYVQELKARK